MARWRWYLAAAIIITLLIYVVQTLAIKLVYKLSIVAIGLTFLWLLYKWARQSWILGLFIENAKVILPYSLGRLIRRPDPEFHIPAVEGIQGRSSTLAETNEGRIVEISFSGTYPPGSFGNEHAARMMELAKGMIARDPPRAVLFNLRDLNYVWGDAICSLAWAIADSERRTFLPACVYAQGRTASALVALFEKGWLFEFAGMKLFRDRAEAESYLRTRLAAGPA